MNTPHLTTPIAVDTLWHTNWGFCVRTVLCGQTTDFFLDNRISWSHREYAQWFIEGAREEHEHIPNKIGTPNPLISGVIAYTKARIIFTQDDIPLVPQEALSTVQRLWNARIERAKPEDKPWIIEYRDRLCTQIQRVLSSELSSVVAIDGFIGVCGALKKEEDV